MIAEVTEIRNPNFGPGLYDYKSESKDLNETSSDSKLERIDQATIDPFILFAFREKLVGRVR